MVNRIVEWVQAFDGNPIDVFFFSDRGRFSDNCFASCYPNKAHYTWNMSHYEKYKDDEAVIMYLAAHEVGHTHDRRFDRWGCDKQLYKFGLMLAISSPLAFLFLFTKILLNPVPGFIWLVVALICIYILTVADAYYEEYELVAEEHVNKLLGPGMVLHGNLMLSLMRKELQKNEKEKGKVFGCGADLFSVCNSLLEMGIEWE